jgi:thiamine-phosphate pyrophosphorylase
MPLPSRIGRLRPPVLCLVVSKDDARDGNIEELVKNAVAGGVDLVQLRDHTLSAGELVDLARKLKTAIGNKGRLVVNDRADVALAVEGIGLHLPENGLPMRDAKHITSRYEILGRSVHSVESGRNAARDGAEYVIVGTIFKSASHPDGEAVGVGIIEDLTRDSSFPVLAIGGITVDNVAEVINAGAAGVAVKSAITQAEDPKAAAEALNKALADVWAERTAALKAAGDASVSAKAVEDAAKAAEEASAKAS